MAFRPPTNSLGKATLSNGQEMLIDEIVAEQASALGHQGRKVEKLLAALRAAEEAGDAEACADLTRRAAREVWAFFVQREMCGMRNHKSVIKEMQIPRAVLLRLGVF